jgi:hypothetical protein
MLKALAGGVTGQLGHQYYMTKTPQVKTEG